jgi:hypothetical protein
MPVITHTLNNAENVLADPGQKLGMLEEGHLDDIARPNLSDDFLLHGDRACAAHGALSAIAQLADIDL